jgi:multicomponent Na+:H+ antiporter subunit B
MKDQAIPRLTAKLLIPPILLFALYVQFHGDFGPGGGFQAGVIFAAAFVLYALVNGVKATQEVVSMRVLEVGIATGVLLYAGVGIFTMMQGGEYLNYNAIDPTHPVHGQHMGILLVELGVGITVASVMATIFLVFAGRERKNA